MKPLSKEERGGFLVLLAAVVLLIIYGVWSRGCVTEYNDSAIESAANLSGAETGYIESDSLNRKINEKYRKRRTGRKSKSGKRGSPKNRRDKGSPHDEHERDYLNEVIDGSR